MPFIDVKPDDPHWEAIQRVGATGILKGVGKSEGWANKMFFNPDSTITGTELKKGLIDFEKTFHYNYTVKNKDLTIAEAWSMIVRMQHHLRLRLDIPHKYPPIIPDEWREVFKHRLNESNADGNRLITRRELAVMIDDIAQNPFFQQINLMGARK